MSRGAERSAGRRLEIEGRQWRCEQRKQSRLTFMNRIPTPRCIQMADKGESPISQLIPTLLATPGERDEPPENSTPFFLLDFRPRRLERFEITFITQDIEKSSCLFCLCRFCDINIYCILA